MDMLWNHTVKCDGPGFSASVDCTRPNQETNDLCAHALMPVLACQNEVLLIQLNAVQSFSTSTSYLCIYGSSGRGICIQLSTAPTPASRLVYILLSQSSLPYIAGH